MGQQLFGIQPSMAGGEFSPSLYARVDISKYAIGLKRCRNFSVLPHGGIRNRPGTKMVAAAGNSSYPVRLIPFVAGSGVSYVLEMGQSYIRFFTADAQVQASSTVTAWATSTAYVVGNFVTNSGTTYYCIVAHTSGTFATDLAAGKWRAQTAYEIPSPYTGADLADLKFSQNAGTIYFAHPDYAPRQLVFTSGDNWTLSTFANTNGPFRLQNTNSAHTLSASALTGSITLTSSQALFNSGHVDALFELIATVPGQTTNPSLTTSVTNWIPTDTTYSATVSGTWSGTILIQTSPDNITWTTVATRTTNGTSSGSTGFTNGYMRAIMQSALSFSGSASVALTGDGSVIGPTTLTALNDATAKAVAGDTAVITLTSLSATGDTVKLQKSTDAGVTWSDLASYTTNQAATSVATTETACHIRALKSVDGGGTPAATVDGTTGAAPTRTVVISTASVSNAIQCGSDWSIITNGTWTGKIRVEISTDGGNNWTLVRTLSSGSTNSNYDTAGETGVSQCLIRVSADPTVAFTGTAVIDLTSNTFDWKGVVKVTAFTNSLQVTATVQALSNSNNTGLANTSSTYQWSEGAWSTYRGFPAANAFFQDRLCWAATETDPQSVWCSQTSFYTEFGISSPLLDSDSISIVLPSRTVNIVKNLIGVGPSLIALTSDAEFSISPGSSGVFTPTSLNVSGQGSRGSDGVTPAIIGIELILMQQMGTVARNMIYQLAVNGFDSTNISILSQHLFTGYSISELAYQQEPDSLVWAVRSDGKLLSMTYLREQEVIAWTWHDSIGTFESICTIPYAALKFNEPWVVYNLNNTRYICRMLPRDMGTDPEDQFFVDCGLSYSGAAATIITGLSHLNGLAVSVLADGNVIPDMTVAGGQITLPVAASEVHVGLPYVSDAETLRIEAPNQKGTAQGRRVVVNSVVLRFWNSRGGYLQACAQGVDAPAETGVAGFDPIFQREASDDYGAAMPLKTYDSPPQSLNGGMDLGATIFFRQVDPLPVTILAFIPEIEVASGR